MTTTEPMTPTEALPLLSAELERLQAEIRQLRQTVTAHAVVDRAIGALTVLGRIDPEDGFTVLREVSQRTNTKLALIAEQILKHAQGQALPGYLRHELRAALARHTDS
ncbi:ANTAR domain-containing protein [Streptomyces sp. NPDC048643]|uniref:ANTAR domain-containing protein n=1 Tax=Streptomyces sp. NPDC048643 TaxID=3155637 RepID=UPI003449E131